MTEQTQKNRETMAAGGFMGLGAILGGPFGFILAGCAIAIQQALWPNVGGTPEEREERAEQAKLDRQERAHESRMDKQAHRARARARRQQYIDAFDANDRKYREQMRAWDGNEETRPYREIVGQEGSGRKPGFMRQLGANLGYALAHTMLGAGRGRDGYRQGYDDAKQRAAVGEPVVGPAVAKLKEGAASGRPHSPQDPSVTSAPRKSGADEVTSIQDPALPPATGQGTNVQPGDPAVGDSDAARAVDNPGGTTAPVGEQSPTDGNGAAPQQPDSTDAAKQAEREPDTGQPAATAPQQPAATAPQLEPSAGRPTADGQGENTQTPGEPAGPKNSTEGATNMSTQTPAPAASTSNSTPQGESNVDWLAAQARQIDTQQKKVSDTTDSLGAMATQLRRKAKELREGADSSQQPKLARDAADEFDKQADVISAAVVTAAKHNASAAEMLGRFRAGLKPAKQAEDLLRSAGAGAKAVAKSKN